jgi:hypothetical protein
MPNFFWPFDLVVIRGQVHHFDSKFQIYNYNHWLPALSQGGRIILKQRLTLRHAYQHINPL